MIVNLGYWLLNGLFLAYADVIKSTQQPPSLEESILPKVLVPTEVRVTIGVLESGEAATFMRLFQCKVADLSIQSVCDGLNEIIPEWLYKTLLVFYYRLYLI